MTDTNLKPLAILGLDFETQDAEPKTTRVTEVGACLYSYDPSTNKLEKKAQVSQLCYEPDYPPQSEKIVELTGITDDMLKAQGKPRREVFENLNPLVQTADIVMAHNEYFDGNVYASTCKTVGLDVITKFWLCTLRNFPWPAKYTCHKLSHLAYEHGILVPPSSLHRAVNDVDLMMELVFSKYNFMEVLAYAREPWVYLKAFCIEPWKDNGVQTGIAKSVGFGWEKIYGTDYQWPKQWVQRIKTSKVDSLREKVEKSESPFRISIIEGV